VRPLAILAKSLYQRAKAADAVQRRHGDKRTGLQRSVDVLNDMFRACTRDRAALPSSKRQALLRLAVSLFRLFFDLNTIGLCRGVRSVVEGQLTLTDFPPSELVAYQYFTGKLDLFSGDVRKARAALDAAFSRLSAQDTKHRRAVLIYLVPVRLALGICPSLLLVKRFSLTPFGAVSDAVRAGNLGAFAGALEAHQEFFIRHGVYLQLEALRSLAFLRLLRRTHRLVGRSERLMLDWIRAAALAGGVTMELDEIECLVANLIFQGLVKGYLSHQHRALVLSKSTPFPSLAAISRK
jgi:hypothetical protein